MTLRLLPFSVRTEPVTATEDTRWLLGPSHAASQLWLQIRRVAPLFRTAFLLGEPGTGAEHAARLLHDLSPATKQPFFMLSAKEAEDHFRAWPQPAVEGLVFLPELERLSHAAQNGLLHFLRRRSSRSSRVVVASSRSLRALVAAEGFNSDLAGALGSIHIVLPALRDRSEDIALLAHNALQLSAASRNLSVPTLSACLLEAASRFSWPGNIDQLCATTDWLIDMRRDEPVLYARDLESAFAASSQTVSTSGATDHSTEPRLIRLNLVIHEHVRSVLSACQGNKLRAAEVLGISRSTLYRMLDQNLPSSAVDADFSIAV